MINKKNDNWGNHPIIILIGLIASLIAIFTFLTGIESIKNNTSQSAGSNNKPIVSTSDIAVTIEHSLFSQDSSVYLNTSQKKWLLLKDVGVTEAAISPNKDKVAILSCCDEIHMINVDGSNHQIYMVFTDNTEELAVNLTWISNSEFQVFLSQNDLAEYMMVDNKQIPGPGKYIFKISNANMLISVDLTP